MMSSLVKDKVQGLGISRLCHFTPSRNLPYMLEGRAGVLPTKLLAGDVRKVYNPTDLERLDGHPESICCSIEYPNAWYLSKAKGKERLFSDWLVLLISPHYLWQEGTLFCPRNAATQYGRLLREGVDGFSCLYEDVVEGSYGKNFVRGVTRISACPTDEQAEVLVKGKIPLEDIQGICVVDETQAKNELARIRINQQVLDVPFYVAPDLFDKYALSRMIQAGERPREILFGE